MTTIQMDLAEVTPRETRALIAMMEALYSEAPGVRFVATVSQEPVAPTPQIATVTQTGTIEVQTTPAGVFPPDAVIATGTPVLPAAPTETVIPIEEKKVRKPRAPKAEAAPAPVVPPEEHPVPAQPAAPSNDPPTIDTLRAAFKGYSKAKGLPAGASLLEDFGVARCSDVLNLSIDQQLEFMKYATGAVPSA